MNCMGWLRSGAPSLCCVCAGCSLKGSSAGSQGDWGGELILGQEGRGQTDRQHSRSLPTNQTTVQPLLPPGLGWRVGGCGLPRLCSRRKRGKGGLPGLLLDDFAVSNFTCQNTMKRWKDTKGERGWNHWDNDVNWTRALNPVWNVGVHLIVWLLFSSV